MPRKSKRLNKYRKAEKCGEIFHLNQSFTIICTSCDEKYLSLQDFTDHFHHSHSITSNSSIKTENIALDSFEAVTFVTELSPADIEFPEEEESDALQTDGMNSDQTLEITGENGSNLNILSDQHRKYENSCDNDKCSKSDSRNMSNEGVCLCPNCGKSFKSGRSLREHMAIHINSRSFVCDFESCGKAFISNRRLINHKLIHTSKRNFICEVCGYRTFKRAVLVAHVRTHTGEKPFPCKICGKHFISSSMVREHAASHSTERRYRCDVCDATFTRPKALYHHKPLHLAVRKFACSICEKTYAQRAGLSAHLRKHKVDGKIMLGVK